MGRKEKKNKKRVVLSLAEFNEDAGASGGHPELVSLPSAPKAPEEWEAEGGRPEYNSRGYRERNAMGRDRRTRGGEDELEERDWTRRGPLDNNESSFGAPSGERDWGSARRDAGEGGLNQEPERDWTDIRRGPIESAVEGRGGGERDWSMRKGPVEAEAPSGPGGRTIGDNDWNSARGQVVDASFERGPVEPDWSVRKPIEAEGSRDSSMGGVRDDDWSARRRGPVEAEVVNAPATRDWSERRGPVEAEVRATQTEPDWAERRGPVESEPSRAPAGPDWSDVRGRAPVDAESAPAVDEQARADSDASWTRRGPVESKADAGSAGSRLIRDSEPNAPRRVGRFSDSDASNDLSERGNWRRDGGGVPARGGGRRGRGDRDSFGRPASTGYDNSPVQRDWGAARRSTPVRASVDMEDSRDNSATADIGSPEMESAVAGTEPRNDDRSTEDSQKSDATVVIETTTVTTRRMTTTSTTGSTGTEIADNDEWTTVRAKPKREAREIRRAAAPGPREFGRWRGSGRAPARGSRPLRSEFETESKAPQTSPVTSVASVTPQS